MVQPAVNYLGKMIKTLSDTAHTLLLSRSMQYCCLLHFIMRDGRKYSPLGVIGAYYSRGTVECGQICRPSFEYCDQNSATVQ
jgi:hypothetical protein